MAPKLEGFLWHSTEAGDTITRARVMEGSQQTSSSSLICVCWVLLCSLCGHWDRRPVPRYPAPKFPCDEDAESLETRLWTPPLICRARNVAINDLIVHEKTAGLTDREIVSAPRATQANSNKLRHLPLFVIPLAKSTRNNMLRSGARSSLVTLAPINKYWLGPVVLTTAGKRTECNCVIEPAKNSGGCVPSGKTASLECSRVGTAGQSLASCG